ncbi:unnamed protein product [Ixodes persulcatus]
MSEVPTQVHDTPDKIDQAPKKKLLRVLVTSGTSAMAHTISWAIAQGTVFGFDQPVILHLLDAKGTMSTLEGIVLELLDCTFPLLRQVLMTTVDDSAFMDIDAAFLLYEAPAMPVEEGVKLFRRYGSALETYAKKTTKAVVCGTYAPINAFVCMRSAPSIDRRNISALTRLEHNQALAQIAAKLSVAPNKVKNVIVWGGLQNVPDAYNAYFHHRDAVVAVTETVKDDDYFLKEFSDVVCNRGRAVHDARKKYPSLSKGKAACDHMHDWWQGTPDGTWVSMGVASDGSYGVPDGIVYSFPVCIGSDKNWVIVKGIKLQSMTEQKIQQSVKHTMSEVDKAIGSVLVS